MNFLFSQEPQIEKGPNFSVRECLEQIFGCDFIGDVISRGPFIEYAHDGFFDKSFRKHAHNISEGLLRYCQQHKIELTEEQIDLVESLSMGEAMPEEGNAITEIRDLLVDVYTAFQGKKGKAEDMIVFFEDMYHLGTPNSSALHETDPKEHKTIESIGDKILQELNRALRDAFFKSKNSRVRDETPKKFAF